MRRTLVLEAHEPAVSGHVSARRMTERLRRQFWWPGLAADCTRVYDECRSCAVNKPISRSARGVFSPNEIPAHRWEVVSMDFLSGVPTSRAGHDFLFIVVDRLTKRMVLIPAKKTVTGEQAARLFVERVVREHGVPRVIISDRDPRFTGAFWRRLHELLGTRLMMSTADHPQTDGQSERGLRSAVAMLRHYVDEHGEDWDEHLWAVEFAYNDAVNRTTGLSPFQADLGRDPATPCALLGRLAERVATKGRGFTAKHRQALTAADDMVDVMRDRLATARAGLQRAQRDAELEEAGRPVPGMEFAAGDYVFLRQDVLGGELEANKLGPRWYPEPLRVSARAGANTYRLMMPKEWELHPVVNVSKLKPAGDFRPTRSGDETETGVAVSRVVEQREEGKATRSLRAVVTVHGRRTKNTVMARTAARRAGFPELARAVTHAAAMPNYLGRRTRRSFMAPETGDMQPYDGLVVAFDPEDPEQQFQVLYEDGDHEWLSVTGLRATLVADDSAAAADVGRLATLHAVAARAAAGR